MNIETVSQLDVAIIGGGLSGLALGYFLKKLSPHRKFMIFEQRRDYLQDRHWSFWMNVNNIPSYLQPFVKLIEQKYNKWQVGTSGEMYISHGNNFQYCVIRSIKFYEMMQNELVGSLKLNQNCQLLDTHNIEANGVRHSANLIIDARPVKSQTVNWWQQFVGHVVKTDTVFEPHDCCTLMQFITPPNINSCAFMYVLPLTERKVLIEPTVFSSLPIEKEWFENTIRDFLIHKKCFDYQVIEIEQGMLAMEPLQPKNSQVTQIGTAAGWMRPSTGYAFERSMMLSRNLALQIANSAENTHILPPYSRISTKLDKVFCRVMRNNPQKLPEIFMSWFQNIASDSMVDFLQDNTKIDVICKLLLHTPHKFSFIRAL